MIGRLPGAGRGGETQSRHTTAATGSIHGAAFHDLNGDGKRNPGKPGLDGKRIHLLNTSTTPVTLAGAGDTDPIIGGPGGYVFANIPPATYRVHELAWSGYVSTLPAKHVGGGTSGLYDFGFPQGQLVGGTQPVTFMGQPMLPAPVAVPMSGNLRGDRSDAERMAGMPQTIWFSIHARRATCPITYPNVRRSWRTGFLFPAVSLGSKS